MRDLGELIEIVAGVFALLGMLCLGSALLLMLHTILDNIL